MINKLGIDSRVEIYGSKETCEYIDKIITRFLPTLPNMDEQEAKRALQKLMFYRRLTPHIWINDIVIHFYPWTEEEKKRLKRL